MGPFLLCLFFLLLERNHERTRQKNMITLDDHIYLHPSWKTGSSDFSNYLDGKRQDSPTMKLHVSTTILSPLEHGPDRQGILYKKSIRSASYQPRWCELRGNLLFYWDRYGDHSPPQLIILEGCTVELQESASEPYTFEISYPNGLPGSRSYKMAAENQETMEGWVRALSTAGFGYLRALVAELESQFQMLKNQECSTLERHSKYQMDFHLRPSKLKLEKQSNNMDFTQLHQKFGENIMKARHIWQEERRKKQQLEHIPKALEGESLIDLG
ncbi:sesquipedalian-1-like isoform X2 [Sceloporus undulatus]|uniref:sesquipedalian-1-like isoform X2 n=1 Tax=Sceloporus undulatus TaxID=8520 RepID=UPI001C4B218C|nr:sesquipedalian-1-like isoform X2 [Sceloporus undulatus]